MAEFNPILADHGDGAREWVHTVMDLLVDGIHVAIAKLGVPTCALRNTLL